MSSSRSSARAILGSALALAACRFVTGFLVAYPAARVLAAPGGSYPHGDRSLFEPGAFYLVETLRFGKATLPAAFEGAALVAVVMALVSVLPLAAVLEVLGAPGTSNGDVLRRAFRRLPAFSAIGGATVLLQVILGAVAVATLSALRDPLQGLSDERTGDLILCFLALAPAAAIFATGVVEDLTRAAIVRKEARPLAALAISLRVLKGRPGAVLSSALSPAAGGALLVAGAAYLTGRLDVSHPGAWRVCVVFSIHQATILAVAALRAVWLARAVAFVSTDSAGALDGRHGLAIDLKVAARGAIPGQIQAHRATPE